MLPLLGVAPHPHSNICNISGNYERIATKFLGICLLMKSDKYYVTKSCNMLSLLGATSPTSPPTPHSNIGNILRMKTGIIYSVGVYQ